MKSSLVQQTSVLVLTVLLMGTHAIAFGLARGDFYDGFRAWFGLHFLYLMMAHVVAERWWRARA